MSAGDFSVEDQRHMGRALALARRGLGRVEPNPMVGAVVLDGRGRVVGEGFHRRFGHAHAEIEALFAAGERARGGTLYVTLEPCCHFGKTPPCTDAVLRAGVRRVVAAMIDPFAAVRGKGAAQLRAGGVVVEVGLMEAEARELNRAFLTRVQLGRPFVIAKWAQSVDGCIATAGGESKWISSEASRAWVQRLRGRMDGILVGIGAVLADDPRLIARVRSAPKVATRIVLDTECRLPLGSQLVKTIADAPVLLVHGHGVSGGAERRRKKLAAAGVMMLGVKTVKGRLNVGQLLQHLGKMEYANVLVEGGAEVMGSFVWQDLVDEAHVFVAPMMLGAGRQALAGGPEKLAGAARMSVVKFSKSGGDVHVEMRRL